MNIEMNFGQSCTQKRPFQSVKWMFWTFLQKFQENNQQEIFFVIFLKSYFIEKKIPLHVFSSEFCVMFRIHLRVSLDHCTVHPYVLGFYLVYSTQFCINRFLRVNQDYVLLSHFWPRFQIYTPWKTPEKQRFYSVFRGL